MFAQLNKFLSNSLGKENISILWTIITRCHLFIRNFCDS